MSRNQEDIADILKRLSFVGVRIVTLSEGETSPLHVGLEGKLLAPDLVAEFIKGFQEETNALNHDRELATAQDKASLARAERSIKSILDAIEDGRYQRSMLDRLDELEREKNRIEARLAKAPPPLPRIHPNIAEIYRAKIQRLEDALVRPDDAREAAEAIRELMPCTFAVTSTRAA